MEVNHTASVNYRLGETSNCIKLSRNEEVAWDSIIRLNAAVILFVIGSEQDKIALCCIM